MTNREFFTQIMASDVSADLKAHAEAEIASALSTEDRTISTNKAVALCNQLVKDEIFVAADVKIPKVGMRKQYSLKDCE